MPPFRRRPTDTHGKSYTPSKSAERAGCAANRRRREPWIDAHWQKLAKKGLPQLRDNWGQIVFRNEFYVQQGHQNHAKYLSPH